MGDAAMTRQRFLTVYDYGQGAVWVYLLAESEGEIATRFPQLRVVESPPAWMTESDLEKVRTVDIDDPDDGFLASFRESLGP